MINRKQKIHLMADLWPAACSQQDWPIKDDARRYALFADVLGHWPEHAATLAAGGHISCNDFVKSRDRDDFGEVKARLLLLAAADLTQSDPVRRTRLWIIRERLMPCYRLYRPGPALTTILHERFKRVAGINDLEDLGSDDLQKIIFTLEARVHQARKSAGQTKHEMCQAAGVLCWSPAPVDCGECAGRPF